MGHLLIQQPRCLLQLCFCCFVLLFFGAGVVLCCLTALSLVWTSCPSPAPPCCSDDRRRSQPSTAPTRHHPYTQSAGTGYLQGQHNTTRGLLFSADACRRRLSRACLGKYSVFSIKWPQKMHFRCAPANCGRHLREHGLSFWSAVPMLVPSLSW